MAAHPNERTLVNFYLTQCDFCFLSKATKKRKVGGQACSGSNFNRGREGSVSNQ